MAGFQAAGELHRALSRSKLARLAGPRSFERGENYAKRGLVRRLVVSDAGLHATVDGTSPYRVELRVRGDRVDWSCSCPVGRDGDFCKHSVAVALVATDTDIDADTGTGTALSDVDLRSYIVGLDHGRLVELVLDLASSDALLDARLRVDAARAQSNGPVTVDAFTDALEAAFSPGGYVSYQEAQGFAETVHDVLDALEGLHDDGHATAVIDLAEHAASLTEAAIGYVDDSDGWLGTIAERIADIHLAACVEARPDPVALATRLFEHELTAETFDLFHGAAAGYADVLGDEGLATYRRLAEAAWARLPALAPGDDPHGTWASRYRLTAMMESLAGLTEDVEAVVAVLTKDLSSPWRFLRIAEAYQSAGRPEDALSWAERGYEAFGVQDTRLVEALAELYHDAGQSPDAVRVVWQAFEARPDLAGYQRLREHASRADGWPRWRDKALDHLRADVSRQGRGDATELVRVHLAEGDAAEAWAEAQAHGVVHGLWLDLARVRQIDHPGDAIPIYQAEIERLINVMDNDTYRQAVDLLATVATLMDADGRPHDFGPYASDVRARHKRKRNLMKLFDQRAW